MIRAKKNASNNTLSFKRQVWVDFKYGTEHTLIVFDMKEKHIRLIAYYTDLLILNIIKYFN